MFQEQQLWADMEGGENAVGGGDNDGDAVGGGENAVGGDAVGGGGNDGGEEKSFFFFDPKHPVYSKKGT